MGILGFYASRYSLPALVYAGDVAAPESVQHLFIVPKLLLNLPTHKLSLSEAGGACTAHRR